MTEKRVQFDFDARFANGGGVQGQDFRLDIEGNDISDDALAAYVIGDLRLLMVSEMRILNKKIIEERHKRSASTSTIEPNDTAHFVDLSHDIESGMVTYKGLPAPLICDHLSREQSRSHYAPGTEFQIGRIEMVSNTGTYIDAPFHRYADGADLTQLILSGIADLPGTVVRITGSGERAIDWTAFAASEIRGRAVLVNCGWDRHWRTDQYFEEHPHLTEKAALYLRDQGAALVGIDSFNIDDVSGNTRPVHSVLLGGGIPIVEHMTRLGDLPVDGFRFWAVPPKISKMGSFPVRAHARIDKGS